MRRPGVVAALTFAVGVIVFAVAVGLPFLTKSRDYPAAITSPPALAQVALDNVRAGARLCMSGVTIEPHSEVARFEVGTYGKPGPPLTFDLNGPGYRSSVRVPAGYADNLVQNLRVRPPARSLIVRACIRNGGSTKIALYSSDNRSRPIVTVGRSSLITAPAFGFWEAKPHTIASRASLTVQRMAVFRGPLGYPAVVWIVLALALLALTVGLAAVLWRAFKVGDPWT
jgi:hypothetical protein